MRRSVIVISVGALVILVIISIDFVRSENGGLGTTNQWIATTSLPAADYSSTSVTYKDFIYELGGCATDCPTSKVDYAPIGFNDILGPWTATTSLPAATYAATSVVYNGYVYEIGGSNGGKYFSTVYFAPIKSNGTIGHWKLTTRLPIGIDWATSVAYNGYIYEIGGRNGSKYFSTVYFAPIKSNGTIGPWNLTTKLPVSVHSATSVAVNGNLYELGGTNGLTTFSTVCFAPIKSNGTIGPWRLTTRLPIGLYAATSVVHDGSLYEIGGNNGSESVSTIDFAPIKSNGSIGLWKPATPLPYVINWATSVVHNSSLYEIGGWDGPGPTTLVDVSGFVRAK